MTRQGLETPTAQDFFWHIAVETILRPAAAWGAWPPHMPLNIMEHSTIHLPKMSLWNGTRGHMAVRSIGHTNKRLDFYVFFYFFLAYWTCHFAFWRRGICSRVRVICEASSRASSCDRAHHCGVWNVCSGIDRQYLCRAERRFRYCHGQYFGEQYRQYFVYFRHCRGGSPAFG